VRGLGMIDASFVVTGSIIGAGIFFVSGEVASHVQSMGMFLAVWVLGGLVALAGALSNGELGALFPRGGGEYVYLREAYGPSVGFLSGWTSFWIGFPGSIATLAYGFSRSVGALAGNNGVRFERTSALCAVVALTAINAFGLRAGKWTQNVLSAVKLVAFVALLALGLLAHPNPAATGAPLFASGEHAGEVAIALIPVMFAYLGWNAATYIAGEIRDPKKNLGRALALGTVVSTLIYVAINFVYARALTLGEMRASHTPAASALSRLLGPGITTGLTVLIAIAVLSSLQATIITGPRIYHAMAEDGLFPKPFARLSPGSRIPLTALLVQGGVACVLLLSGRFEQLLTFTTCAIIVFATLTVFAVFVLRLRRADAPREFRALGYPVAPAFFIAANAWLLWCVFAHGRKEALIGLAIVATGIPAYFFFKRRG
jgi:basic amino acid/polyamine antiporter, APA family